MECQETNLHSACALQTARSSRKTWLSFSLLPLVLVLSFGTKQNTPLPLPHDSPLKSRQTSHSSGAFSSTGSKSNSSPRFSGLISVFLCPPPRHPPGHIVSCPCALSKVHYKTGYRTLPWVLALSLRFFNKAGRPTACRPRPESVVWSQVLSLSPKDPITLASFNLIEAKGLQDTKNGVS